MNRPFSAFGALLIFLALAMFAVSSTTRSTTIQPSLPAPRRSVGQQPMRRMNDEGAPPSVVALAVSVNQAAQAANPTAVTLRDLARTSDKPGASIDPVRVEMATAMATPESIDFRSHYDVAYDKLIYGISDRTIEAARPTPMEAADMGLAEEEVSSIFRQLVGRQRPEPLPQAGARVLPWRLRPNALLSAANGWLIYQLQKWIASARGVATNREAQSAMKPARINWADYSDFSDGSRTPSAPSEDVRSGNPLRHSAASSLDRMILLMQPAGSEGS